MQDTPPPSTSDLEPPSRPAQPYLQWARATDFSYLRDEPWLPLLVEFNPGELPAVHGQTPLQVFASRKWLSKDPRTLDEEFVVPEVFSSLPSVLAKSKELTFCVVLVKRDEAVLRKFTETDPWKRTVLRAHLGPPINFSSKSRTRALEADSAADTQLSREPHEALLAQQDSNFPEVAVGTESAPSAIQRVVIGVIDQGIAFANSSFDKSPGATRIEFLWQQDFLGSTMPDLSTQIVNSPGFEITRSTIDQLTKDARSIGASDDWIYRRYGLDFTQEGFKPLGRRRTHGTHVLDLAASTEPPGQHPIIAVDMPEDAVGDPSGSTLSVHAAWGLLYILSRAELLKRKKETLPIVVNLSYGPHEGPHDGKGEFERFMDQIIEACRGTETPLAVVLGAGNYRQPRIHADVPVPRGNDGARVDWRLQPGSLSPSMMEIWLPRNGGSGATVTLTPPQGNAISVSAAKPVDQEPQIALPGAALYRAEYIAQAGIPNSADVVRAHVVLSIARTTVDPSSNWGDLVAPSGLWKVEIRSTTDTHAQAWIKRSETLPGRRAKGRQSYLDDPTYEQFSKNSRPSDYDPETNRSYVKRFQTLSGIATGQATYVIGGYCVSERYPAFYSSHGTRARWNIAVGPDWLEPSDTSIACRGVLAAGTLSGSVTSMNGSSVAAPQAARRIASAWLALQAEPLFPVGAFVPYPPAPRERPMIPTEITFAYGGGLVPGPRRRIPRK